jgi:superfamily II DNA/RNA helicase
MTQMERNEVITSFKKKEIPVMVATDVAGKNIMSKYYVGIMVTFECEKGKIKFYARHSII